MNEPSRETMRQWTHRRQREKRWWKLLGTVTLAILGCVILLGATRNPVNPIHPPSPSATPPPAWQEPNDFRGLKFGEDVRKALPECPAGMIFAYKERCWRHHRDEDRITGYQIHLGPIGDISNLIVIAREVDHKLALIEITFPNYHYGALLAMLTERYGPPTGTQTLPWQSQAGATFSSSTAVWVGKQLSIVMTDRDYKGDIGAIRYITKLWSNYSAEQAQEGTKKGADALR